MALDWGKDNIQVNMIVPGWIRTEMTTVPLGDIKRRNKIISETPVGRVGEPEDMTGAAVFLASRSIRLHDWKVHPTRWRKKCWRHGLAAKS